MDMKPARKAILGFKDNLITHSATYSWDKMIKVQKIAVINAIRSEGLADTPEMADKLVSTREVLVESNQKYGNVSGMCGVRQAQCLPF